MSIWQGLAAEMNDIDYTPKHELVHPVTRDKAIIYVRKDGKGIRIDGVAPTTLDLVADYKARGYKES